MNVIIIISKTRSDQDVKTVLSLNVVGHKLHSVGRCLFASQEFFYITLRTVNLEIYTTNYTLIGCYFKYHNANFLVAVATIDILACFCKACFLSLRVDLDSRLPVFRGLRVSPLIEGAQFSSYFSI